VRINKSPLQRPWVSIWLTIQADGIELFSLFSIYVDERIER
jgi:hypothetical protein